jgi:hypothetical protein
MAAVLMTELEARRRCMAAGKTCLTAAGCTCHHMTSEPTAAPPDCPPLLTQPGDLSEQFDEPEGSCWTCTAVWLVAVGLAAGMLWFAVRQIIKGAQ